jgi:hypothetical protein
VHNSGKADQRLLDSSPRIKAEVNLSEQVIISAERLKEYYDKCLEFLGLVDLDIEP